MNQAELETVVAGALDRISLDVLTLHAFNLALMEKLMERKQNLGAVRALEPFLRQEDAEAIVKRQGEVAATLIADRQKKLMESQSRLVLPPGAR